MADTIEIVQGTATVVEVAGPTGPQGPQGATGSGLGTLTTQGDTLYQGASAAQRLPIGTAGQILKVNAGATAPEWGAAPASGVTSVNGETGAVTLDGSEIDSSANDVRAAFTMGAFGDGDGIYYPLPDLFINTKPIYSTTSGYSVFFENARWHITDGSPITTNIIESSDDDNAAFPWLSAWSGDVDKAKIADIIGRARDTFLFVGDNLKVGTSSGLPLKTGSGGAVEASSFGTAAGSFCEGDDARLSDDRDPNLHAASHLPEGADEIFDQSLNMGDAVSFLSLNAPDVVCDRLSVGEAPVFAVGVSVLDNATDFVCNIDAESDSLTDDRQLFVPNQSGTLAVVTDIPTTASDIGAAASGSITSSGLTQSTARILGRTTASAGAVEEIQIGSGLSLSAGELSATGSGVTAVGTTLADILSVSGSDLVADDLGADKLYGWDDSESKAIGFIIGSGLSVSGDTLSATASGGSKTYAVFTATDNQPTATAFATLDTRNSIAVLDFDAATDESAVFVGIIPEGASLGSGLKIFLHWMASTATSGNCRWGVQFEKSGTDLDADSFDTATESHSAANGTSGIETVTEITATAIDSLAAGNRFRLKVFRNADDATNDTMTGDAELIAVEVRSAA
jgi:hypothetical protein